MKVKERLTESRSEEIERVGKALALSARTAMGEWLSLPPWDWYTTQTFRADYVSVRLADKAWYAWFNSLRVVAKAGSLTLSVYGGLAPFYLRAAEYQDRGAIHFHSLIGGAGDIRRRPFKNIWGLNGYAQVEAYQAGKGANYYIGKYLTKNGGNLRFSHNLTTYLSGVHQGFKVP